MRGKAGRLTGSRKTITYRICGAKDNDLRDILKAFGIELRPKIYTRGEIRGLKVMVEPF